MDGVSGLTFIGRQHQEGFFEQLLCEADEWYLQCISRTHLEISPAGRVGRFMLKNLSVYPVILGKETLFQDDRGIASAGDQISFIAAGPDDPDRTIIYLT